MKSRSDAWLLWKLWVCSVKIMFMGLFLHVFGRFLSDQKYGDIWARGETIVALGDLYAGILHDRRGK